MHPGGCVVTAPRHTVVVGGGIVGACSAYYLARRGQRVTLLDRDRSFASASAGNAGIVALGHLPMPRPGLARQVLRWMLDPDSPLYIPPRLDIGLIRWFWRFQRACNRRQVEHCMQTLARLGHETILCWEDILATESIECDWRRGGWLDVFRTEAGRQQACEDAAVVARFGFDVAQLDGPALRAREPAFGGQVLGAVDYQESAFLDPARFMAGLSRCLAKRGVTIRVLGGSPAATGAGAPAPTPRDTTDSSSLRNRVTRTPAGFEEVRLLVAGRQCWGVQLAGEEIIQADTVVLAAGIWTEQLAATVGVRVPMQAGKGYHLDLVMPEPPLRTACVLTESFVAITPMSDRLRLAGTVEFSGINERLVQRRADMLQRSAVVCLPAVGQVEILSRWCGLRPCTADGLPVVGWAPGVAGLFIATGHAKQGLTLGPITGRLVSECLLEGVPTLPLAALGPERF